MSSPPDPSPLDYASPEANRRRPMDEETALAIWVFVLGLGQCAYAAWLTYGERFNRYFGRYPHGGGPPHVRLGYWLVDERVYLTGYAVGAALFTAAGIAAWAKRRPRLYAVAFAYWLLVLLGLNVGHVLLGSWPGEHTFVWITRHNSAAGNPLAWPIVVQTYRWVITSPAIWPVAIWVGDRLTTRFAGVPASAGHGTVPR